MFSFGKNAYFQSGSIRSRWARQIRFSTRKLHQLSPALRALLCVSAAEFFRIFPAETSRFSFSTSVFQLFYYECDRCVRSASGPPHQRIQDCGERREKGTKWKGDGKNKNFEVLINENASAIGETGKKCTGLVAWLFERSALSKGHPASN